MDDFFLLLLMYLNLLHKLNLNLFLSRLMFTFTIYDKSIHSVYLKRYCIPCNLKMVDHWVKLSETPFQLFRSMRHCVLIRFWHTVEEWTTVPRHTVLNILAQRSNGLKKIGVQPNMRGYTPPQQPLSPAVDKPIGSVWGFFVISHCAYFHYSTFS